MKPRIIAEKYMEDSNYQEIIDYKLMCFNGKVKCSFVCDRYKDTGLKVTFYDAFGEMTFYPGAGFEEFNPPEWDKKLGDWLVRPDR